MDDICLCPDCHAEHRDPIDATLGHRVRCLACLTLAERDVSIAGPEPVAQPIHLAA